MIYLLRHGDAEEGRGDDSARRLTETGYQQAQSAGKALAAMGAGIDACLTSPKLRAAETAELACAALGIRPETTEALRGGPFDSLSLAAGRGDVLFVGHEPDISGEVTRLTGGRVKMHKGGMAIVAGSELKALLRPRDLAALAATGY